MTEQIITPQMVENHLRKLSKEIDESHNELQEAETHYITCKAKYEIALARTRLDLAKRSSPSGKNYTVGEREDMAILENEELHLQIAYAEALVKGARANAQRIRTQVDIARSVGTSVRTSMDLT